MSGGPSSSSSTSTANSSSSQPSSSSPSSSPSLSHVSAHHAHQSGTASSSSSSSSTTTVPPLPSSFHTLLATGYGGGHALVSPTRKPAVSHSVTSTSAVSVTSDSSHVSCDSSSSMGMMSPVRKGSGSRLESLFSPRMGKNERSESFIESGILDADQSAIYVHVVEARGLHNRSGKADPYACIQFGAHLMYTTTIYGTTNPVWDEECSFELTPQRDFIVLRVWDEDVLGSDRFLGEVRIPPWEYESETLHNKWFKLEAGRGKFKNETVTGEVHVRFVYKIREDIDEISELDLKAKYDLLVKALVEPSFYISKILLDHVASTDLMSIRTGEVFLNSLLNVFQNHTFKATMHLIEYCVNMEVAAINDPAGLFRRNSVAPKILTKFAQSVGSHYLSDLLKPLIQNVAHSNKTYEIDSLRVKDKQNIEKNAQNLSRKCQKFLDAILDSAKFVPIQIQWVAHLIRRLVVNKFPDSVSHCVASFFFLRYLCPAIVAPNHFGIVESDKPIKTKTSRFLILIAKTLQSVANRATEDEKSELFIKEPYMRKMEPFVSQNRAKVHNFLMEMTEVVGKSDVLPAFEHLDRNRYLKSLLFLHSFLATNLNSILSQANSDQKAAPTGPTVSSSSGSSSSPSSSAPSTHATVAAAASSSSSSTSVAHATTTTATTTVPAPSSSSSHSLLPPVVEDSEYDPAVVFAADAAGNNNSVESFLAATANHPPGASGGMGVGSAEYDINVTQRRSVMRRAFETLVKSLGDPPAASALPDEQASEDQPLASSDELSRKPNILKRIRARMVSNIAGQPSVHTGGVLAPSTAASVSAALNAATSRAQDRMKKYLAIIADQDVRLEERGHALAQVHRQYQSACEENENLRRYIMVLQKMLTVHKVPVPPLPPELAQRDDLESTLTGRLPPPFSRAASGTPSPSSPLSPASPLVTAADSNSHSSSNSGSGVPPVHSGVSGFSLFGRSKNTPVSASNKNGGGVAGSGVSRIGNASANNKPPRQLSASFVEINKQRTQYASKMSLSENAASSIALAVPHLGRLSTVKGSPNTEASLLGGDQPGGDDDNNDGNHGDHVDVENHDQQDDDDDDDDGDDDDEDDDDLNPYRSGSGMSISVSTNSNSSVTVLSSLTGGRGGAGGGGGNSDSEYENSDQLVRRLHQEDGDAQEAAIRARKEAQERGNFVQLGPPKVRVGGKMATMKKGTRKRSNSILVNMFNANMELKANNERLRQNSDQLERKVADLNSLTSALRAKLEEQERQLVQWRGKPPPPPGAPPVLGGSPRHKHSLSSSTTTAGASSGSPSSNSGPSSSTSGSSTPASAPPHVSVSLSTSTPSSPTPLKKSSNSNNNNNNNNNTVSAGSGSSGNSSSVLESGSLTVWMHDNNYVPSPRQRPRSPPGSNSPTLSSSPHPVPSLTHTRSNAS